MTFMLPTSLPIAGSLTDVVPSLLSSLGVEGFDNTLALPSARSSVLVIVDGLGEFNLHDASGHARFLLRNDHDHRVLQTVFPSTTASALSSLMTGASPGEHGVVGYRVREPQSSNLYNQLNELDKLPADWMRTQSLSEVSGSGAKVSVVGRAKFADSGLSRVIYRGATYVSAESIEDRCSAAASLVHDDGHLVLLYISELDSLAHKLGVTSSRWSEELESVDAQMKNLRRLLPPSTTMFVTADHGVVDVDPESRIVVTKDNLLGTLSAVGGEPRCLQLYVRNREQVQEIAHAWREEFGHIARVMLRDEVVSAGLLGRVSAECEDRLGHIFVMASEDVVFYDGNDTNTAPRKMVGQHGALSEREMLIPFIEARHGG